MKDTLTYEDIIKAAKEIEKHAPKQYDNPFAFNPMKFGGMRVFEAKPTIVAKVKLSESFAEKWLTEEAKNRINAKLIEMLGTRDISPIAPGIAYMFGNNIISRSETCAMLLTDA